MATKAMLRVAFALILFMAAAIAAWSAAPRLASLAEARYEAQADATLSAGGFTWAKASIDGLKITLTGPAPSAAAHADAMASIAAISPVLTVEDAISKSPAIATAVAPPDLEVLKGEDRLILAGRVADLSLVEIFEGDATLVVGGAAAFSAEWAAAAPVLRDAAQSLRYARITIGASEVRITGLAEQVEARAILEERLNNLTQFGWRIETAIDAPLTPLPEFRLTAYKTPDLASVSCAAATFADAAIIEATAKDYFGVDAKCSVGAGAPNDDWARAATIVLKKAGMLEAAAVELTGALAILTVSQPTSATDAINAEDALTASLPSGYRLVVLDQTSNSPETPEVAPFSLTIDWPGGVSPVTVTSTQNSGGLERARASLSAYAKALFPGAETIFAATNGAAPPAGWRRATRIGLDALSTLQRGKVEITDGAITLTGAAARPEDIRVAHETLSAARSDWSVGTRIAYDPAPLAAAQPLPPQRCADQVGQTVAAAPVSFQPASTKLTASGMATVDRIAAILMRCDGARFEIGGHTDAQGSEAGNLALSRARAEAVLSALIAAKAPPGRLIAKGYGEAQPIADNGTAVGRALNRRIEFKLLDAPE